MKERIKTFRFTCDGWYYDKDNNFRYCQEQPETLTLTGTKEEIENELSRLGWTVKYVFGEEHSFLCPRVHGDESYNPNAKVRYTDNEYPAIRKQPLYPLDELADDQKIDRFFNAE